MVSPTSPKSRNQNVRIITWNANGILSRKSELTTLLRAENIDIALVTETHLTSRSNAEIKGYNMYLCHHPSGTARGGSAIYIKENILHHEAQSYSTTAIQATVITARLHCGTDINIASVYCPPSQSITANEYETFFNHLGYKWIAGGDYNAKHHLWGSRIINKKGRELYKCINTMNIQSCSNGLPTYWPTDQAKKPDCVDFFLTQRISESYIDIKNLNDLTSDHSIILVTLNNKVRRKCPRPQLASKHTDWEKFRELINVRINLRTKMKTAEDIDNAIQYLQTAITEATKEATPSTKPSLVTASYPQEVMKLIKARRAARHRWQTTRDPADKSRFNCLCKQTKKLIAETDSKRFDDFLYSLDPTEKTNYSLWKVGKVKKKPPSYTPPLKEGNGTYARSEEEKATVFANHLERTFQPNNIASDVKTTNKYVEGPAPKLVKPKEIQAIIQKLNMKKAPGMDLITARILAECPHKVLVFLTYIFNASFRLCHFSQHWKVAKVIMLAKPGKSLDDPASYRPISLLPILSKIFEKLIYSRLLPIIDNLDIIPEHQFGFRAKHSTVEQIHRVVNAVRNALEAKEYCPSIFLDVRQAFDRVWIQGLIHKIGEYLPTHYVLLIESYLHERKFRVHHGEAISNIKPIAAGVPQGSVLGPLLYVLYTADIPITGGNPIATFADDTATLASNNDYNTANDSLQKSVDEIIAWTNKWKIQLNTGKSVKVNFALRPHLSVPTYINGEEIPTQNHAKYLGLHIDSKLMWKTHILKKCEEVKARLRSLFWLLRAQSKLSLNNKRLLYITVIRPIWSYGGPIWGCTADTNLLIVQRLQNLILRKITGAPWFVSNDCIHKDLNIPTVKEVVRKLATSYEKRIHRHTNSLALQLLENPPIVRLKRKLPTDLVCLV